MWIEGGQRRQVTAGRVPHEDDLVRRGSDVAGVLAHPADGSGNVIDLIGMLDRGREPVVDADEHDAVLIEELGLEADVGFVALGPFATMNEDDRWRVLDSARRVYVESLLRVGAVGLVQSGHCILSQDGGLRRAFFLLAWIFFSWGVFRILPDQQRIGHAQQGQHHGDRNHEALTHTDLRSRTVNRSSECQDDRLPAN
jgi:hypothetical protein